MITMTTFFMIIRVMIMITMTTFLLIIRVMIMIMISEEEGLAGDQSAPTIASRAAAKNTDNPER